MLQLKVGSFRDLMQHGDCTIKCFYSGQTVRTLTVVGDICHILAGDGSELDVPLDTLITYEPWTMDRGNMLFEHEGRTLKICGEADILTAESGFYNIEPEVVSHE